MTATKIITPTAEERKSIRNGEHYEQFTVTQVDDYEVVEPIRTGIVAQYTDLDYGYLIQQVEGGFRWISVEGGETDDFGPLFATKRAAIQGARSSWHSWGGKDNEGRWSRELAKDADAPERIELTTVSELIGAEVGAKLTAEEIEGLAAKLAELVNAA